MTKEDNGHSRLIQAWKTALISIDYIYFFVSGCFLQGAPQWTISLLDGWPWVFKLIYLHHLSLHLHLSTPLAVVYTHVLCLAPVDLFSSLLQSKPPQVFSHLLPALTTLIRRHVLLISVRLKFWGQCFKPQIQKHLSLLCYSVDQIFVDPSLSQIVCFTYVEITAALIHNLACLNTHSKQDKNPCFVSQMWRNHSVSLAFFFTQGCNFDGEFWFLNCTKKLKQQNSRNEKP